jgi:transcriptional regulator with XRE-family HTH domain
MCDMARLNEKIRTLATSRGLDKAGLARLIDSSQTTVGPWWNGTKRPDLSNALKLAKALGVPLEFLADDDLDVPSVLPPIASEISPDEAALLEVVRASGVSARELRVALIREGVRTLVRAGSPGDGFPGDPDIDVEPHRLDPDIDVAEPRPPGPEVGKPVGLVKLGDRIDPPPPRPRKPKR